MELVEGKIFYEIFKTTDKDWISRITTKEIKESAGYSEDLIEYIKLLLERSGEITIMGESIKINATNSRLY
jgi:hypothetical protein